MKLFYGWIVSSRRRPPGVRRDRYGVLARGVPAADGGCDRLVAHRRVGRHDVDFMTMGVAASAGARCSTASGRAWSCSRRRPAGAGTVPGQPRHQPARIPAHLRPAGRRRRRRGVHADDGDGDRVVREASQSRGIAGVGRHGHGADDGLALRELADRHLRLAHRAACDRHPRRVLLVPAALSGAPAPGDRSAQALRGGAGLAMGSAEPDMTAGHALRSPQFSVLSLTFSAAAPRIPGRLPYRELRHRLRPAGMTAVTIYSVEGLAGLGAASSSGWPATVSAPSACW